MGEIRFTWESTKASGNERKHRVSFEEAQTVFLDERAKLIDDPEHSASEERFVLLGISEQLRVLVVCHSYRDDDREIRLISARKATKREQHSCWERKP